MSSAETPLLWPMTSQRNGILYAAGIYILGVGILTLGACTSTVIPQSVSRKLPDLTGTGLVPLERSKGGWLIDEETRDKYNALIEIFGQEELVPLKKDAGLIMSPDGRWFMPDARMVQFGVMARKYREGRK